MEVTAGSVEAPGTYRSDNVAIFDLAGERRFRFGRRSVDLFLAAFNQLNSNAATGLDEIVGTRTANLPSGERVSYARFLRPSAILPPRVLRVGIKARVLIDYRSGARARRS